MTGWRRLAGLLLAAVMLIACEGPLAGEEESEFLAYDAMAYDDVDYDAMATEEVMAAAPAMARAEGGAFKSDGAAASGPVDELGRRIIREGRINIEVEDVLASFDRIDDIARQNGGFVAESSVYSSPRDEQGVAPPAAGAYLRLRVPADRFDAVRAQIGELAETVLSQGTSSQDVTMQVADFEARLRNLHSTEEQYLGLLADAANVEEVLQVSDRLNETRGEIERIEAQLTALAALVDLATLHVDLERVIDPEEEDTRGPLDAARQGWDASWQVLEAILEWSLAIIAFSWWIAPLAALGAIVAVVLGRRSRRAGGAS